MDALGLARHESRRRPRDYHAFDADRLPWRTTHQEMMALSMSGYKCLWVGYLSKLAGGQT